MSVPVPEGVALDEPGPARSRRALPRPARGRARLLLPFAAAAAARRARHRARHHAEARPPRGDRRARRREPGPAAARAPRTGATGSSTRRCTTAPRLGEGATVDGPALIEEPYTVVVLPPGRDRDARRSRQLRHLRVLTRARSCSSPTSTGTGSGTARSRCSAAGSSTRSTRCSICSTPIPASASCSTGRRSCSRTTSRCGPIGAHELVAGLHAGRLAAGPWYVQPDSLLPGGRDARPQPAARARGRGRARAGVDRRATCPTRSAIPRSSRSSSPASGSTRSSTGGATAPSSTRSVRCTRWRAPDGSAVRAWQLARGLLRAPAGSTPTATSPRPSRALARRDRSARRRGRRPGAADERLRPPARRHVDRRRRRASIGAQRVLLDDAADAAARARRRSPIGRARSSARASPNLLPGRVVGAHAAEVAQPRRRDAAHRVGRAVGRRSRARSACADERPALEQAWRTLLLQPGARLDLRLLDRSRARAHGRALRRRRGPRHARPCNACSNGSPGRTSRARHAVAARRRRSSCSTRRPSPAPTSCACRSTASRRGGSASPASTSIRLSMPSFAGVTVDGRPARLVPSDDPTRVRFLPGRRRSRRRVRRGRRSRVRVSSLHGRAGRRRARRGRRRRARSTPATCASSSATTARSSVTLGDDTYDGLFGIEDAIDRGDSYDCDPDPRRASCSVASVVERARATRPASQRLRVVRASSTTIGTLTVEAVRRARACRSCGARSTLDNRAPDHRLRLRFPTGAADRHVRGRDDVRHRAPLDRAGRRHRLGPSRARTFPHQGWIAAQRSGRRRARDCPEAEVTPRRRHARHARAQRRRARPHRAAHPPDARPGPEMLAPGAQTQGPVARDHHARPRPGRRARRRDRPPRRARWRHSAARAGASLLELDAARCVLSACKPAQDGDGIVVRVLNPDRRARRRCAAFRLRRRIRNRGPPRRDAGRG